jgi:hypothetical protein
VATELEARFNKALRSILEWTGARDGTPETDEANLRQIAGIAQKALEGQTTVKQEGA